ncbi:MAG TPA: T9SS type A sorting domain-containing protein [Bacteroidia bacterium]|nr:T9SS type A sorting domain-containing protein [Bacteroidia bacterium]
MKNYLLALLLVVGSVQITSAQAPQKLWDAFFNGALAGKDESNCVLTDAAGNVFVTGTSFENFTGGNFTTIKYDPNGVALWTDHFANTQASYKNYGRRLVIDKWENVYGVGTTALHEGDLAVCKYDGNGRVWAMNYEPYSFSTYDDYGIDMAVDSSGNFYAIARVNSPTGNLYDMYLLKCDSSGTKIWDSNYSGASDNDYPVAVRCSPGGTAYTLLQSFNFFGTASQDITTLQYLSSGTQNWFSKYNGPGNGEDFPMSLEIDGDENQYISGTVDAGSNSDMVTMKQNSYGTRLWVSTYNGTANGNDTAISATWLPNGYVVVAGKCRELLNASAMDAIVTQVIDSGTVVSTGKYFGTDSLGAVPTQMITDAQGNSYICGYENVPGGTTNGCIIKYDSNGNLLWNISYDAGANLNDKFNAIALDDNNDIVVTGQTFTSATNANYVTVKYGNSALLVPETNGFESSALYPNPATAFAILSIKTAEAIDISIAITDLFGRTVGKEIPVMLHAGNNTINLNVADLKNGIYFVRTNRSDSFVKKLVVQK